MRYLHCFLGGLGEVFKKGASFAGEFTIAFDGKVALYGFDFGAFKKNIYWCFCKIANADAP